MPAHVMPGTRLAERGDRMIGGGNVMPGRRDHSLPGTRLGERGDRMSYGAQPSRQPPTTRDGHQLPGMGWNGVPSRQPPVTRDGHQLPGMGWNGRDVRRQRDPFGYNPFAGWSWSNPFAARGRTVPVRYNNGGRGCCSLSKIVLIASAILSVGALVAGSVPLLLTGLVIGATSLACMACKPRQTLRSS